jgi:ankyrin repeat protein
MFWQFKRHSAKGLLLKSARVGNLRLARKALGLGANPDTRDGHGRTALCLAAKNDHPEMIRMLVEAGADINFKLPYGRTPIYQAIHYGSLDTVKLLIELGADIQVEDKTGQTPYSYAKAHYRSEMAAALKLSSES